MTSTAKRRAILFLMLAALITVLLAAALPQLELQRGVPLPGWKGEDEELPVEAEEEVEPQVSVNMVTFLEAIFGLFVLLAAVYIFFRRRRLTRQMIAQVLSRLAMLALFLTILLFMFSNVNVDLTPSAEEILPLEIAAVEAGPPLAPLPSSMLWLVWIGLAGMVVLLVVMLARMRVRVRIPHRAGREALALEAEQAVKAIKAGQDVSNVIIRCYRQMSEVLKKEQGLTLEKTMTAREFEALLEKRGIPNPPVRQLTRLFELARYTAQAPGQAEEAQAVECLNAIAQAVRKKGPGGPK